MRFFLGKIFYIMESSQYFFHQGKRKVFFSELFTNEQFFIGGGELPNTTLI